MTTTFTSFGGTTVITTSRIAGVANNIAASQTPVSGTPLTLTATPVVLDDQRRVIVTPSSEAAQRTLLLTGTDNTGVTISETLTIPATSTAVVQSQRDYKTIISAVPGGGGWTGAMTLGTNGVASTVPQLPAHFQAIFDIGFECNIVSGSANFSIEFTRDIPYAIPQIYTSGFAFVPPICLWLPWPTLQNITDGGVYGDIDSAVTAWRLTINSGTGVCQARATPVGLRT
jgi:hypothetical protein